jgi:hypothetical protein
MKDKLALVAHTCNPSYSDREDHVSKPAWANSLGIPHLQKSPHKKGLVEWLEWQELLSSKLEIQSSNPNIEKKIISKGKQTRVHAHHSESGFQLCW